MRRLLRFAGVAVARRLLLFVGVATASAAVRLTDIYGGEIHMRHFQSIGGTNVWYSGPYRGNMRIAWTS